ncbi:hypothetical protein GCM10027418_06200 [Mariniluteicoccus endophyticus]
MSKTLSELLSEYRERSGLSYGQMAEGCGLSKARVYQLATGRHGSQTVTQETLRKLSRGLGLSMADLAASARAGDPSRDEALARAYGHLEAMDNGSLELAEAILAVLASRGRRS